MFRIDLKRVSLIAVVWVPVSVLACLLCGAKAHGVATLVGGEVSGCQGATGSFFVPADRALSPPVVWLDDFCPLESGSPGSISWRSCFFDYAAGVSCAAPERLPPEDFLIRIFADDGGVPGMFVGEHKPAVLTREPVNDRPCWDYFVSDVDGFVLNNSECYWLEISGSGTADCGVFWATSVDGNGYAWRCVDELCSMETEIGGEPAGLGFCLGMGLSEPPVITGGCCLGPGVCRPLGIAECLASGGVFLPGEDCSTAVCPSDCAAETCDAAMILDSRRGGPCLPGGSCQVTFDTRFCREDSELVECQGEPGGPVVFSELGSDLWASYRTDVGECGVMEVSTCLGQSWDGVIAVYDVGASCSCPVDTSMPLVCGDDTCGIGGGPSRVEFAIAPSTCYQIRVGGWNGASGTGELWLNPTVYGCGMIPSRPLADDRTDLTGARRSCDQANPCPGDSSCIDGWCYVPRQRYVVIRPAPDHADRAIAYRVALDTEVAGIVPLGFVQCPSIVNVNGPGPNRFSTSSVGDSPCYEDWPGLLSSEGLEHIHIGDCEISAGHTYIVQAIEQRSDIKDESGYSRGLVVATPEFWGDVTGGGEINSPPNGAPANLIDVFATVLGFQNIQAAPKDWLDMEPLDEGPDLVIGLPDAFRVVQAFQGQSYGGLRPESCP